MDRKKLMCIILKEIEKGNEPSFVNYEITKELFGETVEMALEQNFITSASVTRGGIGNKVQSVFMKGAKITFDGLEYLENNCNL